jgi:hypothetical protein
MANIPLNPRNVRFGDIAQRANPQARDPLQNQNNAGFPAPGPAAPPPRFSEGAVIPVGGGRATTLAATQAAAVSLLLWRIPRQQRHRQ